MSDELLCPICGKDRLHFIGELADCSHSTIEVIEYAIILRKQLDVAVEALRQAECNLYGNPSAWITHKIISDALAEIEGIRKNE